MEDKTIYSEPNKTLVTQEDNKALWNLPKYRRTGYRDLYKINRYGLVLRSDHVLKLNKAENSNIENIASVKDMTNQSSFCSLIVGKDRQFYLKICIRFSPVSTSDYNVNYKNVY